MQAVEKPRLSQGDGSETLPDGQVIATNGKVIETGHIEGKC